MKIWKSEEKSDDKIIAYFNNTIFRVNPKPNDVEEVIFNFTMNKPPRENYTGVPLRYLKEIDLEDGKNYIVVLFNKDSYEHLRIKNPIKRNEIFEYFKSNIPNSIFVIDKYSKIRAGKKPLIAMCVVAGIFLWTFYVSNGIEQGGEYKVIGSPRSLANIVLGIASLGTKKVELIFSFLFAIALASFIFKIRRPKIIRKIIYRR